MPSSTTTTVSPIAYSPTFWFDAADSATVQKVIGFPAANGETVSFWQDKSANALDAQSIILANRPTYYTTSYFGKPSVYFSLISQSIMYLPPLTLNGDCTFFIATSASLIQGSSTETTVNTIVSSKNIQIQLLAPEYQSDNAIIAKNAIETSPYNGSLALANTEYPNNGIKIYAIKFTKPSGTISLSIKIWENGSLKPSYNQYSSNLASSITNYFYLGVDASSGSTTAFLDGTINEIIFYNSSLTDDQINNINSYLIPKWTSAPSTTTTPVPTRKIQQVNSFSIPSVTLSPNMFYPVSITVSGFDTTKKTGKQLVKRYGKKESYVTVFDNYMTKLTLNGVNVNNFSSLNVLLVPPNGKGLLLLGNNGKAGSLSLTSMNIVSSKVYKGIYNTVQVPDANSPPNIPITNPKNNSTNIFYHSDPNLTSTFPYPAPQSSSSDPYGNGFDDLMLSVADGEVNGLWKLYFWDNVGDLSGTISSMSLTLDAYEADLAIGAITTPATAQDDVLKVDSYGGKDLPRENGPYPYTITGNFPEYLAQSTILDSFVWLNNFQLEHFRNLRLLLSNQVDKNTLLLTSGNGPNNALENNYSFYSNSNLPVILNNISNGSNSLFNPIPTSSISPVINENYPIKLPSVSGFNPPLGYPANYLYSLPYGINTNVFDGNGLDQNFYLWGYDLVETSNGIIIDPLLLFTVSSPTTTTTTTPAPSAINYNLISGSSPNSGPEFAIGVKNDKYSATSDGVNFAETIISVDDPSGFKIQGGTLNGSDSIISIDGIDETLVTSNVGSGGGDQYVVIGANNGVPMSGLVGEVLLYSGDLDPAEQENIVGYLSSKWNIPLKNYHGSGSVSVAGSASIRVVTGQTFISDASRSLFMYGKNGLETYISSDDVNFVQATVKESLPTNFNIYYGVYQNVLSFISENGSLIPVNSNNAGNNNLAGQVYLGSNPNFPQFNYTGATGEYILYNRALSQDEIDTVVGYLSLKWGVSVFNYYGGGAVEISGTVINGYAYSGKGSVGVLGVNYPKIDYPNYDAQMNDLSVTGNALAETPGVKGSGGITILGNASFYGDNSNTRYDGSGSVSIIPTTTNRFLLYSFVSNGTFGNVSIGKTRADAFINFLYISTENTIIINGSAASIKKDIFNFTSISNGIGLFGSGQNIIAKYRYEVDIPSGTLNVSGSAVSKKYPLSKYTGSGTVGVLGTAYIEVFQNGYDGSGVVGVGGSANAYILEYTGSGIVDAFGSAGTHLTHLYQGGGTVEVGGSASVEVKYFIVLPMRYVVFSTTVVSLPMNFSVGLVPTYGYRFVGSCNSSDCLNCNSPDTGSSTCVNTYSIFVFATSVQEACQVVKKQHWAKPFKSVARWSIPAYGNQAARLALAGELDLYNGFWTEEDLCGVNTPACGEFCIQTDAVVGFTALSTVETALDPNAPTTPVPGPRTCFPNACTYTWSPLKGLWELTESCSNEYGRFSVPCVCSGSPSGSPPNPYIQQNKTFPCVAIAPPITSTTSTTTNIPGYYYGAGGIAISGIAKATNSGTINYSYSAVGGIDILGRASAKDRYYNYFTAVSSCTIEAIYSPPLSGIELTPDTSNSISSLCGCVNIPNKIVLNHNLIQSSTEIFEFFYRNNITYTQTVELTSVTPVNGYNGVQIYNGKGEDDSINEQWIFTYDLICSAETTISGDSLFRLDIAIKKKIIGRESNATKITVYIPTSYACTSANAGLLQVGISIDPINQSSVVSPNLLVENTIINDQIEYFSQGSWLNGQLLNVSLASTSQTSTNTYITQQQLWDQVYAVLESPINPRPANS